MRNRGRESARLSKWNAKGVNWFEDKTKTSETKTSSRNVRKREAQEVSREKEELRGKAVRGAAAGWNRAVGCPTRDRNTRDSYSPSNPAFPL